MPANIATPKAFFITPTIKNCGRVFAVIPDVFAQNKSSQTNSLTP